MAEIQSVGTAAWRDGAAVQALGTLAWRDGTTAQSIGSTYTPPPAAPGSTVVVTGDLTPRTEILPAATYRSAHTPVMRNVRVLGDPFRYFYAPLTASAADTIDPQATFTVTGTPTFTGAGMVINTGAKVNYSDANTKLNASNYTVGVRYRVRCENLTSMPPPFNSSGVRFFTLAGFGHEIGFMTSTGGSLRVHEYHALTNYPEVVLGTIPNDCVLSIVYPAGSGVGELWVDDTKVYTSPVDSRFAGGISLGLNSAAAISSLRFSQLRMERIPSTSGGLALEDGQVIPAISGSIDLPDGSAQWRLSATIPRASYDLLRSGEQPPLASVALAGRTWVFLVDEMSAPRAFASTDVSIRGVSLAALADAPYELARQWTSDAPTTAAQIATLAQTFTGLDVDWHAPDWGVPAAAWSYTGTPWGAVLQVAAAVQAVVEADPADLKVKVTSRYPVMPQEWATTAPDVQIPWQAVESENVSAADRPPYTGVFVTGPADTIAAVRLAGTSGAEQAPLISGDLLTDLPGQAELGRTVLAQSGGAQTVSRTLQVLTGAGEPGVIDRGKLVRWVDPDATWTGMVRSVRVDWQFGQVRQTIACERRTSFPVGSVAPPPPPPPPGDPFWSDVIALMHFDGDVTNSAAGGITFATVGGAAADGSPKFGSAALDLHGTSPGGGGTNSLTASGASTSNGWGLTDGDFTFECWVYFRNPIGTGYAPLLMVSDANGTEVSVRVSPPAENAFLEVLYRTGAGSQTTTGAAPVPVGAYVHVAVTRENGTYRVFANGIQGGQGVSTYAGSSGGKTVRFGSVGGFALDGTMDEIRVTKRCRYTADFAPPSAPFPTYSSVPAASVQLATAPSTNLAYVSFGGRKWTFNALSSFSLSAWARSSTARTGKRYWEIKRSGAPEGNFIVGVVARSAYSGGVYPGSPYGTAGVHALHSGTYGGSSTGRMVAGSITTNAAYSAPTGSVVMVALDFTTGAMWLGINGAWIGGGDPATGANPTITLPSADVDPYVAFYSAFSFTNGRVNEAIANFSESDLQYSRPVGFATL